MASRGLNKAVLIGHLGQDPEVRYSPNGVGVCNISVATNDRTKDSSTGEWQDHTEWHRVVLFSRLADVAKEYLRKGSQIYIEGRLKTRKYLDKKDNVERYATEIVANEMIMLGGKGGSSSAPFDDYSQGGSGSYGQNQGSSTSQGGNAPREYQSREPEIRTPAASRPPFMPEPEDDVPF